MLRVCIYGAGAIGLDLAVELIDRGHRVALVARGANLEALRDEGLALRSARGDRLVLPTRYRCADDPALLGAQDLVFVTTKSGALDDILPRLAPLLGPTTEVIGAHNGLPPWYAAGRPTLEGLLPDPSTRAAFFAAVPRTRCVGAVVHRNAAQPHPGTVERKAGTGIIFGALDGHDSPALATLVDGSRGRDFSFTHSPDIHGELWRKLLINASLNPLSVVCERPLDAMVRDPGLRRRLGTIIEEVHGLGELLGVVAAGSFDVDALFARFAAERRGAHTSMVRDYWAGRPLELDRIVRAPLWLAAQARAERAMPELRAVLAEVEAKAGALAAPQSAPPWL